MPVEIAFLGTGAAGGTPGTGRSARLESSALLSGSERILVDVTPSVRIQLADQARPDAIVLTHGHRDAAGGFAELRSWCRRHGHDPIPVLAHPITIERVRERFGRLDHVHLEPWAPGRLVRVGRTTLANLLVPHADERFPTYALRFTGSGARIVYASDLGALTPELRRFARGADLLVLDGAMWGRQIHSHLTADIVLPKVCRWRVDRIVLTQIGRTAPPHETLRREVRRRCERALPAHDGLHLSVGDPS